MNFDCRISVSIVCSCRLTSDMADEVVGKLHQLVVISLGSGFHLLLVLSLLLLFSCILHHSLESEFTCSSHMKLSSSNFIVIRLIVKDNIICLCLISLLATANVKNYLYTNVTFGKDTNYVQKHTAPFKIIFTSKLWQFDCLDTFCYFPPTYNGGGKS